MADQPSSSIQEHQAQLADADQVRQQLTEAQEALERETYRLDTLEITVNIIQSEIDKLESGGLGSFVSSLLGTKARQLDEKRQEIEETQLEQRECAEVVKTLTQSVDQLTARLAELGDMDAERAPLAADAAPESAPTEGRFKIHDLEQALEAGESLVKSLGETYALCSRARRGPNMMPGGGALLFTAMQVSRSRTANVLTEQIADSVRHFCSLLERLDLGPEHLSDVCSLLPQLQQFTEASSLASGMSADAWAELEVATRSIVADLQDELRRTTA